MKVTICSKFHSGGKPLDRKICEIIVADLSYDLPVRKRKREITLVKGSYLSYKDLHNIKSSCDKYDLYLGNVKEDTGQSIKEYSMYISRVKLDKRALLLLW